jgi:hypothetical protein
MEFSTVVMIREAGGICVFVHSFLIAYPYINGDTRNGWLKERFYSFCLGRKVTSYKKAYLEKLF